MKVTWTDLNGTRHSINVAPNKAWELKMGLLMIGINATIEPIGEAEPEEEIRLAA